MHESVSCSYSVIISSFVVASRHDSCRRQIGMFGSQCIAHELNGTSRLFGKSFQLFICFPFGFIIDETITGVALADIDVTSARVALVFTADVTSVRVALAVTDVTSAGVALDVTGARVALVVTDVTGEFQPKRTGN